MSEQNEEIQEMDIYILREPFDGLDMSGCTYRSHEGKVYRVFGMLPSASNDNMMEANGYKKIRAVRKRVKGKVWSAFMEP